MSNYPESSDPSYAGRRPAGDYPEHGQHPEERAYPPGATAGGPPMGSQQYAGEQYGGGPVHQPTRQFSGYGGASSYQGGGRPARRGFDLRSTFKTTEFWIFVVVALGVLITAAIVDEDIDGLGFSSHEAWRLVTFLAIGYMISRGLTKFGGKEHD